VRSATQTRASSAPSQPKPTPSAATNASSGSAVSDGGQAQTTTNNTQLGAGVTGGGDGTLTVQNQHTSSVADSSSANAQSGISVALAPTLGPGTPAPAGVTTANSGHATANGLTAQNTVSNTSLGAVHVAGQNDSAILVSSASTVTVANTGASAAESGQAWAVANGAAGGPSGVSTPGVTAAAAGTTVPANNTGLTAQNQLSSTVAGTMVVPAGSTTPGSIDVRSNQVANVEMGGSAAASSGSAKASGTPGAAGAQASSGSAAAQGLTAQNTVNTNANVSVNIGGQNFAPIQVIVESITNIFNWGLAAATSGDATAGSGAAPAGQTAAAGGTATSGSAQATGAQIQNTVDLHASGAVHVAGDNHNPINIVLNLAADLVNWGFGSASSGDVQSTGVGGNASSGATSATGLQVTNLINMWADASVDIEGNNYAPIYIHIKFKTNIENYGAAAAKSGNVAAGTAATTVATTGAGQTSSTQSGSASTGGNGVVGTQSHARSGDAIAIANSVDHIVNSTQLAGANSGSGLSATTITQLLQQVPPERFRPFVPNELPANNAPAVQDGLLASSGDSVARGMESVVIQNNTQLAGCSNPGPDTCAAINRATLSFTAKDLPVNPITYDPNDPNNPKGSGSPNAGSGFAGVNVTPTPVPARVGNTGNNGGSGSGRGSSGGGRGANVVRRVVEPPAYGHVVVVDLWSRLPGRRLPPMPGMLETDAQGSDVSASLGRFPGVPELPLPELATPPPPPSTAGARAVGRQARTELMIDMQAEEDQALPVLNVVDADFWSVWPAAQAMPMPWQAARGVPATQTVAIAEEPDESGASSTEFGLTSMLALLLGAIAGSRRGRLLLGGFGVSIAHAFVVAQHRAGALVAGSGVPGRLADARLAVAAAWARTGTRIGRQTARGLAIVRLAIGLVRLTIGMFRIWH